MKSILRWLLLLVGLALFGWFIHQAEPAAIWKTLKGLGWAAPLILLPYLLVYFFDTIGWHFAFRSIAHHGIPPLEFARIRWAGEAVNNVVPSAYVGGEAVKVYLLRKRGVPLRSGTQSAVASKTLQTLAQVLAIAVAAALSTTIIEPGTGVSRAMLYVTLAAAGVVVALFRLQRRGFFTTLLTILRKLRIRIEALESREEQLAEIDREVVRFYTHDTKRFVLSTLFYFFGWAAGAVEILVAARLFGIDMDPATAFAIEAFVGVAKGIGLFSPGSLGVQEAGIVLLFKIFGLPDAAGTSYAILRRGREVVYAAVGGWFLLSEEASVAELREHVRQEIGEKL